MHLLSDAVNDTQTPTEASDATPVLRAKLEAIGPYRLKEIIGEGGMGSVYHAEQTEPVWREVAIKVTRIDLGSAGSLARFEAERQILATLNHPNIAQVYEAGSTADGFPYMVMEYIGGDSLCQYCDRRQLDIRQRVELFIKACHAVHHAHQRGVIHRDIKPSNILVADGSDKPVPKLIDFGIAKLAAAGPSDRTIAGTVLGTPVYMSPEQLEAAADVDTRTDVYSLGVVLYQLLAGVLPRRDAAGDARSELRQWLEESTTLAKRPSKRLAEAEQAADIAAARATSLDALKRSLSSELDWIVLRAMAPERDRRYDSAAALGTDLQRYLDGQAVMARPLSRGYLLRKFIGRHKLESAFAALLLLAVIAATFIVFDAWRKEHAAHEQAQIAADEARAVNDFLLDMMAAPDPRVSGREVRVVDVLDKAADKARNAFPDKPLVRAALLETLGRSYNGLGQGKTAIDLLVQAFSLRRQTLGADHVLSLETENELLEAKVGSTPIPELYTEMTDFHRRTVASLGETHPLALTALNNHGFAAFMLGGELGGDQGSQYDNEGLELQRQNLALRERVYGIDDERTTHARNNLANVLNAMKQFDEAETLFRDNLERQLRLYGEDNHYTLSTMNNLAGTLDALGKFDESMALYKRSLQGMRRVDGVDHPSTLMTQVSYGSSLLEHGDPEQGEALLREVIEKAKTIDVGADTLQRAHEDLIKAGLEAAPAAAADKSPTSTAPQQPQPP